MCQSRLTIRRYVALTLVVTSTAIAFVELAQYSQFRGSDQQLEAKLRTETPIGASAEAVAARLGIASSSSDAIFRAHVDAGSKYPPTTVGGEAFLEHHLGTYGLFFRTDVSAFYIFDGGDRLVDIRVVRSTDAL